MPGLFDGLWHGRPAGIAAPEPALPEPQEQHAQFDPQVIAYVNNGVNPLENAGVAPPGAYVDYNWIAEQQIQQAGQQMPIAFQHPAMPTPWEFRQQIFPQAIETRLSKEDVEKIAERILVLIEEREAE